MIEFVSIQLRKKEGCLLGCLYRRIEVLAVRFALARTHEASVDLGGDRDNGRLSGQQEVALVELEEAVGKRLILR